MEKIFVAILLERVLDGNDELAKQVAAELAPGNSGSPTLANNRRTNESMTYQLASAYRNIGKELGISVAYVGLAFFDLYTSDENVIELYHTDFTHPSPAGSYLAAMTLFVKIFAVDPRTVDFSGTLSESDAAVLKSAA